MCHAYTELRIHQIRVESKILTLRIWYKVLAFFTCVINRLFWTSVLTTIILGNVWQEKDILAFHPNISNHEYLLVQQIEFHIHFLKNKSLFRKINFAKRSQNLWPIMAKVDACVKRGL